MPHTFPEGFGTIGNWYSSGDVSSKVGNTVSYGYAAETFKLQADVIMDGRDTGGAVDESQFGLAVNIGDIGTVALGYEKAENAITDKDMDGNALDVAPNGTLTFADGSVKGLDDLVWRYGEDGDGDVAMVRDVELKDGYAIVEVIQDSTDATNLLTKRGDKYYSDACKAENTPTTCGTTKKYLIMLGKSTLSNTDLVDEDKNPTNTYTVVDTSDSDMILAAYKATGLRTDYGHKASHISASFGLGAVTARLGYTSKDSNNPADKMKEKTTFFGMNGSIGDTGMDWRAWGRNVEGHDGKETSPWGAGVGKALGGGAYAWIEHRNKDNGESGNTFIALNVDF